jgi:hypothetical protein
MQPRWSSMRKGFDVTSKSYQVKRVEGACVHYKTGRLQSQKVTGLGGREIPTILFVFCFDRKQFSGNWLKAN